MTQMVSRENCLRGLEQWDGIMPASAYFADIELAMDPRHRSRYLIPTHHSMLGQALSSCVKFKLFSPRI